MIILIFGLVALAGFLAFVVALFACCIGCVGLVGVACTVSLACLCVAWLLVQRVERG